MWTSKKSTELSIAVCAIMAVFIVAFSCVAPWMFKRYFSEYRGFGTGIYITVLLCYYPSALLGEAALVALGRMLFSIRGGDPFCRQNVRRLRLISAFCFCVAIITFAGGFMYIPFFYVCAATGFVGLILRVVKNVMQSAVEMREESDLTV